MRVTMPPPWCCHRSQTLSGRACSLLAGMAVSLLAFTPPSICQPYCDSTQTDAKRMLSGQHLRVAFYVSACRMVPGLTHTRAHVRQQETERDAQRETHTERETERDTERDTESCYKSL